MEININKIVSADELALDTQIIHNKLNEESEIIVFENNMPQFVIISLENYSGKKQNTSFPVHNETQFSSLKIGKYVQESMKRLFYEKKLNESEIERLTTNSYSNNIFNLNFAVLKKYDPAIPFDEQKRDTKGYNRYYSFMLSAYGNQYLLCSQWVEYLHREKFEDWLARWENKNV